MSSHIIVQSLQTFYKDLAWENFQAQITYELCNNNQQHQQWHVTSGIVSSDLIFLKWDDQVMLKAYVWVFPDGITPISRLQQSRKLESATDLAAWVIDILRQNMIDHPRWVMLGSELGMTEDQPSFDDTAHMSLAQNALIREELMAAAWHPSRFKDWCLSIDERAELTRDLVEVT